MKMNIECRTVRVPAKCLPAGTYFRYKLESRDELDERQSGVLLVTDTLVRRSTCIRERLSQFSIFRMRLSRM